MCDTEPLVSMDSAGSTDALYKLLEERKHLSTSSSTNVSLKWPAARNDHYCDQKVCCHAVLDLSPLCVPSDNDSDDQSHATPGSKFFNTQHGTVPTGYSQTGSYSSGHSRFDDECSGGNFRRPGCDQHVIRPRLGDCDSIEPEGLRIMSQAHPNTGTPTNSSSPYYHRQYTPPSSYDGQDLRSPRISSQNLDSNTYCRALRQELDNLHISSAASYVELEERFVGLSDSFCTLSLGYGRLVEKHDSLLHMTSHLCRELGVHAKALTELAEWKLRTQKSFAEVQVQGEDPELLYYDTPLSTSTVEILTGQVESYLVTPESRASRSIADEQDSGVAELDSPSVTPGSPLNQDGVHPRLVLRLPSRPDTEDSLVESSSGSASHQHAGPKRVRKPTAKRKAAALQAESTGEKAKKSRR